MNINISNQKKYPQLTEYVKNSLPKVKHNPKITEALLKSGEIKKKSLGRVLSWGTQPTINVVFMSKNQCGEFTPNSKSNEIRISRSLVEEFENSGGSKKSTLLLGATILHELVHWGDDQDGKDIPGEEGNLFETSAYGMVIPCLTK
jgi:zincin-like metallopeptidase toxin 3 of polymorphic toxin system